MPTSRPVSSRAARITVALLLPIAAVRVVSACSTEDVPSLSAQDGGDPDGTAFTTACPPVEPQNGSECLLPEGTTCDFGACGTRLGQCTRGAWAIAGNTPPKSICPPVAPNAGVMCPACWSPAASCSYGSSDCTLPDASDNTTIASCPDGGWEVTFQPCRDAGPDVQGDGGPDAD